MLAQGDAQPHRHRAGDRPDQGAGAPRPMESRHQHAAREPLDGDGLGVHRHVEHPLEEAPEQEGDEERRQRTGEPDERPRDAVAEQGHAHHPPTSHLRQEAGRHHHGQDRADGSPEQGESEPTVAQVEVLLQLRDVGRPGGEQEAVDEEDGDDGQAWPAVAASPMSAAVRRFGAGTSVRRSARRLPPSATRPPSAGRLRHR